MFFIRLLYILKLSCTHVYCYIIYNTTNNEIHIVVKTKYVHKYLYFLKVVIILSQPTCCTDVIILNPRFRVMTEKSFVFCPRKVAFEILHWCRRAISFAADNCIRSRKFLPLSPPLCIRYSPPPRCLDNTGAVGHVVRAWISMDLRMIYSSRVMYRHHHASIGDAMW